MFLQTQAVVDALLLAAECHLNPYFLYPPITMPHKHAHMHAYPSIVCMTPTHAPLHVCTHTCTHMGMQMHARIHPRLDTGTHARMHMPACARMHARTHMWVIAAAALIWQIPRVVIAAVHAAVDNFALGRSVAGATR